jgi:hypothetical protein
MFRTARIGSWQSFIPLPITSNLRASRSLHHTVWRAPLRRLSGNPPHRTYSTRLHKTPYLNTLAIGFAFYLLIELGYGLQKAENDAPRADELASAEAKGARIDIIAPERGVDRVEQVPTGTSTVPFFPRKIWLPRTGAVDDGKSPALPAGTGVPEEDEEYQLLGLGIRTVSFLSIQVYVVGLYIAHSDLATLQETIVHAVAAPGASTLVQGEKGDLKQMLLEDQGSEKIWSGVLKEMGLKSALRIVPTRSTNFGHLRDGWVRGITARSKGAEFADSELEQSVGKFKAIFGGRKLGKGKALLLGRSGDGSLRVWVEEDSDDEKATSSGTGGVARPPEQAKDTSSGEMVWMGGVKDERISRLVWMGYLAGGNVASEGARKSVVEGVMELVERPIGTVETQVV